MQILRRFAALGGALMLAGCAVPQTLSGQDAESAPAAVQPSSMPGASWRCPQVVDAAARTGWEPALWRWVDVTSYRESRCHPEVTSRYGHIGAMQIEPLWTSWGLCDAWIACNPAQLYDLDVNLRAARHIFAVQGPGAW
jgi:hypothetical protein